MPSQLSAIWKYFTEGRDEKNVKTGKCNICNEERKCTGNSTTTLWVHLSKEHSGEYEKIKKLAPLKKPTNKSSNRIQPSVKDLISSNKPYGSKHSKQLKFDSNMEELIVGACLPFKVAENPAFRNLVNDLDPKIRVKARTTYSRRILKKGSIVKMKAKRKIVKDAASLVAFTTDLWEDSGKNTFASITSHYVNEDFELVRVIPAIRYFDKRHRGPYIAEAVGEEIKSVSAGPNQSKFLVSDSCSNMENMRKQLVEEDIIDTFFGCSVHKIQNCIKDANQEAKGVKNAMSKAKRLIKFIKKSTLATLQLKKACASTNHRSLKLKTCLEIRWNSEYDAFKRLLYHQPCMDEMDRNRQLDKVSNSVLNRTEWRILEGLIDVLKPVKELTILLQVQSSPTINRLGEGLFNIVEGLKHFVDNQENSKEARSYAKKLHASFMKRFPNYGLDEKIVAFANFFDPHLKGIHLKKVGNLIEIKGKVKKLMSYGTDQNVSIGENEPVNLNREDSELTATEKLINIEVNSSTNSASDKDKKKDRELDLYVKMQRCERNGDVLKWWKENSVILPALSGIAKAVLCVPAGSVASEQLFSIAGLFDTVKMGSLNVET